MKIEHIKKYGKFTFVFLFPPRDYLSNVKKAEKSYRLCKLSLAVSITAFTLDCIDVGLLFGKNYFFGKDNEINKHIHNVDKYLLDIILGLSISAIFFGSFTLSIFQSFNLFKKLSSNKSIKIV